MWQGDMLCMRKTVTSAEDGIVVTYKLDKNAKIYALVVRSGVTDATPEQLHAALDKAVAAWKAKHPLAPPNAPAV